MEPTADVHSLNEPADCPRRVLLCITGLTPQVVTETLYALAVRRSPAFIPTEILLLTTESGAEAARLHLLGETRWVERLCQTYRLPRIPFSEASIEVVTNRDGVPLKDILTQADNELVADVVTERICGLTADAQSAVHVSLAGGRKTMGYYAGYALSLYGRAQDRLSHVLVSPPRESQKEFYFPAPEDPADTVQLAELPFVRLRHGLPESLLNGETRFSEAVQAVRRALEPPSLYLGLESRTLICGGHPVSLPPSSLAFYAAFVANHLERGKTVRRNDAGFMRRFLELYRITNGDLSSKYDEVERVVEESIANGDLGQDFDYRRSRLNCALKKQLGIGAAPYLVAVQGQRPRSEYGLFGLLPEAVSME